MNPGQDLDFHAETHFFCTRPSPGLLPVLGPLVSGTDTTHQPSPALKLLSCWFKVPTENNMVYVTHTS